MLVDTHCHLNFNIYDNDRDLVIENARQVGIKRILNPGINLQTSLEAVKLSEEYNDVYAAVGIHPNDALSWNANTIVALRKLSKNNKVIAIGEIGLDYYRENAPRELQISIFREQLELALELNLPVIIHTRNSSAEDFQAIDETFEIIEDTLSEDSRSIKSVGYIPGVLHSFSSRINEAQIAVGLNFMIGISGPVTFKQAEYLKEVVEEIGINKLLIETDAPFLTPAPYRGKRNQPANVKYIAEKISEIKELPYDFVVKKTWENSKRIFNW